MNEAGVAAVGLKNVNGGPSDREAHFDTDYATITGLRARLTAISAGTYTTAYLDKLTMNDMIYAVRLNDSPSTIR